MLTVADIKKVSYKEFNKKNSDILILSENTSNTWQLDRNDLEIKADTSIGKIAESIVEFYIFNNLKNIIIESYDSFRVDDFKKHAPFDSLIYNKDIDRNTLFIFKEKILKELDSNDFGKISDSLKRELSSNSIYIVEIKSTRLSKARHFKNNLISFEDILKDDFLEYPKYLRTNFKNDVKTFKDYLNYVNWKEDLNLSTDELKLEEFRKMSHLYIRVFIDEDDLSGYIIGYLSKDEFKKNLSFKSMKKKDKSENALYLSCNLKYGKNIDNLQLIKV